MAVKSWPAGICPASVDIGLQQDVQRTVSRSGKTSTFEMPGARWVMTLTFRNTSERTKTERPRIEALVTSLRSGANRLLAPYFGRPVPNGTLRGTPRLDLPVIAGASTVALRDCNGTLRAGDLIGLGAQVVMVEQDAAPVDGKMVVAVNPAVRAPQAAGTVILWDRPNIQWVLQEKDATKFPYRPGQIRPSFSIELMEDYL